MFHILSSMLGFDIDATTRTLTLNAPYLSPRAGTISIKNMHIGCGSADFIVSRKNGAVVAEVTQLACRGQGHYGVTMPAVRHYTRPGFSG